MTTTILDLALKSLDDQALIEMTLAGQEGCFDVLMERHLGMVRKCVRSMIPQVAEAEDVLQEVQLKIWKHLASFRADSGFRTWITRIAVNESLQSIRRAKRERQRGEMKLDEVAGSNESPFRSCARQEVARTVRSAIHKLPLKFRQILILRDLCELSVKEAARRLNSSVPLVKSRLFRARIMLSKALQHRANSRPPDWRAEIAA
jgi:RNA polymerase sigma-70 factor (ECF subfamily)